MGRRSVLDCSQYRLGKAAARSRLERGRGWGALEDLARTNRAWQAVVSIDCERQPPGADLGGAGDGVHGGTNHGPHCRRRSVPVCSRHRL